MKKILILANKSGGLYGFRRDLIQELVKKGYEVYASTPFDVHVESLQKLGINLIETKINRRGMNPIIDFSLIVNYWKIIKDVKPSLIITYTIKPNLYGNTVARFLKVPYAINITGLGSAFQSENFIRKMVTKWYKFVCEKSKIVFFENTGNRNVFIDEGIVSLEKTFVLNGAGVNLNDYQECAYPSEDQPIHFLFIGRIMKEKGIDEFLEAAKRIKSEYSSVEFDVVGPLEDDYKDIITNSKFINYHGFQSDVKPFIEKCSCFVLPSYHEGMANTLLESASIGRPLITSDIYGCKEAVRNNGYLVKVKDSESLYEAMKEFIKLDYSKKVEMAKKSRELMEEVFDKRKVVQRTIEGLEI